MELNELKKLAKEVASNAYAPHSNFSVGCALVTKSGDIFTGCNIESDSVTFNICAERNAISTAISKLGKIEIDQIVIYTATEMPAASCGLCRQLIHEFGRNAKIYSFCDSDEVLDITIQELLPHSFELESSK